MVLKLDKYQLQFLLNEIQNDNAKYGLVLKLIYTYGRNINEVLQLRVPDINFEDGYITFNINQQDTKGDFPITASIGDDLLYYLKANNIGDNDFLFVDIDDEIKLYRNRINHYLGKKSIALTQKHFNKPVKLSTKDFKILRGKHLFLDGVPVKVIHDLYCFSYIKDTKNIIEYPELMQDFMDKSFPYTYDDIFSKLSYLDTIDDGIIDVVPEFFTISDGDFSIMVCTEFDEFEKGENLFYTDGTDVYNNISPLLVKALSIPDKEEQENYITFLSDVIKIANDDLLEKLKTLGAGNSVMINDLKISKN